jgi:predicted thioesterase
MGFLAVLKIERTARAITSQTMAKVVGRVSLRVGAQHLAPIMKTGAAKVLSTAILAAVMEEAACAAINSECARTGMTSVGAKLNLVHKRPTAPGATVTATAVLDKIDARGIYFTIEASDETGLIGTAQHTRVFVNQADFENQCYAKAKKAQQTTK